MAYNDFIQKIMNIIDKVAPLKEIQVKQNSQEWFDWEIADEIKNLDKLFRKFKKSKLQLTKIFIMRQGINYRKLLLTKKEHFLKTN